MGSFVHKISLLLFVCFAVSCGTIEDLQINDIKGFQVNKISTKGIDGDITLSVKNPNHFGFSIYRSEFDVTYSGVYLGKAKLAKKVKIKANTEEDYAFNITSDLSNTNLLDVMKLLNGSSFKNELEVKGDLKAGKFLLRRSFPVHVKEKISLK